MFCGCREAEGREGVAPLSKQNSALVQLVATVIHHAQQVRGHRTGQLVHACPYHPCGSVSCVVHHALTICVGGDAGVRCMCYTPYHARAHCGMC